LHLGLTRLRSKMSPSIKHIAIATRVNIQCKLWVNFECKSTVLTNISQSYGDFQPVMTHEIHYY